MGIVKLMKSKMFFLIIGFINFIVGLSWTQEFYPIVEKNGLSFHEMEITKGLTLFSIVQLSGSTGEELLQYNPGCDKELKIGQKLLLPLVRKSLVHKVKEKETLFAISKRYLVPIDSIIFWNYILDKGIKVNQNLKINHAALRIELLNETATTVNTVARDSTLNQRNFNFNDQFLFHIVETGETLSSLAKRYMVTTDTLLYFNGLQKSKVEIGAKIKIPINQTINIVQGPKVVPIKMAVKSTNSVTEKKQVIRDPKIAVFLPFSVDSVVYPLNGTTKAAVEFYLGALLGIKDLEEMGIRGEVTFFDYLSESARFPEILSSGELSEMDLIYAPLHAAQAQLLADYCLKNKIKIVFPLNLSPCDYTDNPFAYQVPASKLTLATNLAQDVYKLQNGAQIVLVGTSNKSDSLVEAQFVTAYNALPKVKGKAKLLFANEGNYASFSKNNLPTWYVSFETQKDKIISLLGFVKMFENCQLFGLKEWLEHKEITSTVANEFSFNYESSSFFNYSRTEVISFHKLYRSAYQADVTKMACLGYDMITVIPKVLFLNESLLDGTITRVLFGQEKTSSYIENKASFLLKFIDFETINYLDEFE